MVWHKSNTMDFAGEWFTPITTAGLNKLVDNVNHAKQVTFQTRNVASATLSATGYNYVDVPEFMTTFNFRGGFTCMFIRADFTPPAYRADGQDTVSLFTYMECPGKLARVYVTINSLGLIPFGAGLLEIKLSGQNTGTGVRPVMLVVPSGPAYAPWTGDFSDVSMTIGMTYNLPYGTATFTNIQQTIISGY